MQISGLNFECHTGESGGLKLDAAIIFVSLAAIKPLSSYLERGIRKASDSVIRAFQSFQCKEPKGEIRGDLELLDFLSEDVKSAFGSKKVEIHLVGEFVGCDNGDYHYNPTSQFHEVRIKRKYYENDRGIALFTLFHELGHVNEFNGRIKDFFPSWKSVDDRYKEELAADKFAIDFCSDEGLLGGRRLFRAVQLQNLDTLAMYRDELVGTVDEETGDNLKDVDHPTFTQRIETIEAELARRGVTFDRKEQEQMAIDFSKSIGN